MSRCPASFLRNPMKKLLFSLCLLPLATSAQTTTQKVLYMKVERNTGTTTARLEGTEDFLGPIYNPETKRLFVNGAYRSLSALKGIRFEIKTEEVADGIEEVTESQAKEATPTYDLSGRKVNKNIAPRGIYIIGKKKFIKK